MIMESNQKLPFRVGQQAESKSFIIGFRSAWFRCEIKDICIRRGHIGYSLEFFDYPDEKATWTKLYQKPKQHIASHEGGTVELMVRPSFPPFYRASQLSDQYPVSDVVAVINDTWKVGDLVDWWSDCCYWSGRVIKLLGNDKVQIQLPEPPTGEGKSYAAFCKDLRPSLDWSPENGWTVPLSRENDNCWHCARLIKPHSQGKKRNDTSMDMESESVRKEKSNCLEALDSHKVNDVPSLLSSSEDGYPLDIAAESSKRGYYGRKRNDTSTDIKSGDSIEDKPNYLFGESDSHIIKDTTPSLPANISSRIGRYHFDPIEENHLQRYSGTIESSIVKLEELATKIRWIKGFLQFGYQWSNAMKPSWRLLENYGASPKM